MKEMQEMQRKPSYEELEAENQRLQWRLRELEELVAKLKAQLEETRRAGKRQAAPFSKGEPKENPKRAGRKVGHPPAHAKRPKKIDRVVDVPLPFERCPDCLVELVERRIEEQFQTDIPKGRTLYDPIQRGGRILSLL